MDLARVLMRFGLDLAEAHDALDRIAGGEGVDLTLTISPTSGPVRSLEAFGVGIAAR